MGTFSPQEFARYHRHLILPEIGHVGQQRLKAARVLIVGAGGLGCPCALYLAAAGVGQIGLIDDDCVDRSNLQRQILYHDADVGRLKVEVAVERLRAINPDIECTPYRTRLAAGNAMTLFPGYDLIIDGSDNFPTRYLVNDASVFVKKPFISGSLHRFEGQVTSFAIPDGPCYRCLYPTPPSPGAVPNCAEAGVLGVVPGIVGSIQAAEAIKWIVGGGTMLHGRLLLLDAWTMAFHEMQFAKDPACPICGTTPTIRTLETIAAPPCASDREVDPTELHAALQRGETIQLIDVREPEEYAICRLDGSTLIPLGELHTQSHQLARDRAIILYCHHGRRSLHGVAQLEALGFCNVRSLRGGIQAWAETVDPSMPRY